MDLNDLIDIHSQRKMRSFFVSKGQNSIDMTISGEIIMSMSKPSYRDEGFDISVSRVTVAWILGEISIKGTVNLYLCDDSDAWIGYNSDTKLYYYSANGLGLCINIGNLTKQEIEAFIACIIA